MASSFPIVVVGGGVIGLLCARELAVAGERTVVLDRQSVGRESSWAGGGILSPLNPGDYNPAVLSLSRWSQNCYGDLCSELAVATGIDPQYIRSGLIRGGIDGGVADDLAALWNSPVRMLQGTELANVEPEVHWQGDRATLFDEIAQVRNPRLMQALIADVRARGVEIRESVAATGFEVRNGQVAGIHTRSGLIETRRCIVAAGAWTGELMRGLDLYLPIQPVRGQMLLFKGEPVLLSHMVMQGSHYLIPRRDGRILGGSTLEFVGFDKTTTEVARKSLVDAAVAMVPVLAECEVEAQWAGLRPGSPEGIPYIGEHPKIHGLHVCSGHFRNGLVMAPASARLMADLVLGRAPILDPGPYGLDRP